MVSGPGGVGKGTLVRASVDRVADLWLSRSWTSRARRPGESSDAYEFVTAERFRERIAAGGFLEWVEFLGNLYGTPTPEPPAGADVLLEIELEGAQVVRRMVHRCVLILVVPPSEAVQRERLERRGDAPERIEERIEIGRRELATGRALADEVLINDSLTTAVDAFADIVARHRRLDLPATPPATPET